MRFKYTATNTEGKTLTGVINSESEEAARNELNNLGFSILEINEVQNTEPTEGEDLEKYEFEATDKNGKKIKGTIPAKTPILAFQRLIQEYGFTINYLASIKDSPEEKALMRSTGTEQLTNQYNLENGQTKEEKKMEKIVGTKELNSKKTSLSTQVDSINVKINEILIQYETTISPEKRAEILGDLDKILRIKSSNNLDYIRNSCKEILKKIQNEELFLNAEQHQTERQNVIMESEKMLLELDKTTNTKEGITDQLKTSVAEFEDKISGTKLEFIKDAIEKWKTSHTRSPEETQLKNELKQATEGLWDNLKIAMKASKETKKASWGNVRQSREAIRTLKTQLRAFRERRHEKNLMIKKEKHILYIEEVSTFTGWLLSFYLIYYFFGHYVVSAELAIEPFLGIPFDLSHSALFKYLLSIIFITHVATSLKLNFFLRSHVANFVLVLLTLVLSLITIFNF
jgi:hypothetical protein